MANARQLKILKMGAWVWNKWRVVNRHVLIDLSEVNLRGASLPDIDLSGALLRGANLSTVELSGARLDGADLSEAYLEGADLQRANLSEAKFRKAHLRGAQLNGANLREANLRRANLTEANLSQAKLGAADLTEANLTQADLSKASLNKANLNRARLSGANLREAHLHGANLSKADLRYARLIEADLWEADLWKADLRETNLDGADLREANLSEVDLSYARLIDVNLREAFLSGAVLRHSFLFRTKLIGANLWGADLSQASLEQCDCSGADLRGAILEGTRLNEIDLKETDLRGANLIGADLRRAKLQRTKFFKADLQGIIFKDPERPPDQGSGVRMDMPSSYEDVISISNLGNATIEATWVKKFQIYGIKEPLEEVSFTAIYPKESIVETWHTLLVYAHLLSALEAVRQDAQRFKDQIIRSKEVTSASSTRIARGTEMTIVPYCEGVVFNPERAVLKWLEDYQRADFRFRADKSLANDAARGHIDIYIGPLLVGSLKLAMLLSETDSYDVRQGEEHIRAMLLSETYSHRVRQREEHVSMYHEEDIFISYSHKDSEVVLACKKAYEAIGFNVLIDRDTLRSGENWNSRLMYMIDRATIFQLFWSQNSSQSEYCRQEWQHALKRHKDGFIRPVYWEVPMPDPPEELSKYHFEYMQF